MKTIFNILLYAGLTKEQYESIQNEVHKENRKNLKWYSLIMSIYFALLGIASNFFDNPDLNNTSIYAVASLSVLITFLHMVTKRFRDKYMNYMVYYFMSVLYIESVYISTCHPDYLAVTFLCMLLIVPNVFALRPLSIILYQIIFEGVFIMATLYYKNADVASLDLWNSLSFLGVSIAYIFISMPIRFGSMEKSKRIQFVSEHDLLTGLKNRNAYESFLSQTEDLLSDIHACVYIDANGLHELNNTEGHAKGDHFLRTIATMMQLSFGKENTYRIGGDEFVIFCKEAYPNALEDKLRSMEQALLAYGYHISFGYSQNSDIRIMIKEAEQKMYQKKTEYYLKTGLDRRRRVDF